MSLRTTHVLGIVGAVVVFVATAITWYTHDISVTTRPGQIGFASSKAYTLWDTTTLAPVLLVIAAAAGAILMFVPLAGRTAGTLAGLLGLGIAAYCIVGMFELPDLGRTGSANGLLPIAVGGTTGVGAHASTALGAGPFVGLLGGAMLAAAGLGLVGEAPEAATAARRPPSAATPTAS
jgi:hypothetical protein